MRSVRRLLAVIGPVGLCGLAAASGAVLLPGPATASLRADAWIEVTPSPVTAGRHVALRADCGAGETAATVTSTAFGRVSLHPFAGRLFAEVLVPVSTRAGGHSVSLACSNGETASATLRVSTSPAPTAEPSVGPHTGGGFLARQDRPGESDATGPSGWLIAGLTALAVAVTAVGVSRRRGFARAVTTRWRAGRSRRTNRERGHGAA
jgi:hypothetical protein